MTAGDEAEESDFLNPVAGHLRRAISSAKTAGNGVGLLLVHAGAVDRIDALQGFHAGDQISGVVTSLLRDEAVRKSDFVELLSRDEFVCVLQPLPSEMIAMVAAHRALTLLDKPLKWGEHSVAADASIGVSFYPDHGTTPEQLLQRAKFALRSAQDKRERIGLYAIPDTAAPPNQLIYETRLRLAIENNLLTLFFQPQLDLRTNRIIGAEALLRWQDEVLGNVPPNLIVSAAESSGLIDQLTFWVITSAIQWCAQFRKVDPAFTVSINVSPSNLREPDLPYHIDRAMRTWGVPGENVVIEITETAILTDQQVANEALRELKSHRVHLSIDDFGTGYSSIYYLAQLPLDELKIDIMFVRGMLEVPNYAKIVRSLIDLAHNLELKVVAEGIENQEIMDALAHLGCERGQGYHIGKPVPAQDLLVRLRGAAQS